MTMERDLAIQSAINSLLQLKSIGLKKTTLKGEEMTRLVMDTLVSFVSREQGDGQIERGQLITYIKKQFPETSDSPQSIIRQLVNNGRLDEQVGEATFYKVRDSNKPVQLHIHPKGVFEILGYPFGKDDFKKLKDAGHVTFKAHTRGQLWEECSCGQEPVCAQCFKCSRHCKCGASFWSISLDGILEVLQSGRGVESDGNVLHGTTRDAVLHSIEQIGKKKQEAIEKARKQKEEEKKTLKQQEEDFKTLMAAKLEGFIQLPEGFTGWEKVEGGESHAFGKKMILEEVSVNGEKAWRLYLDIGLGDDIRTNIFVPPEIAADHFKSQINENNGSLIYEGIIKFFPDYAKAHNLRSALGTYGNEGVRYVIENGLIDASTVEALARKASEKWFSDDHPFSWGSTRYIQIPNSVEFINEKEGKTHEDLMQKIEKRVNELAAIRKAKLDAEQKIRDEEKQAKISKITAEKEKEIKSLSKEELVYKYDYLKKSWSKEKMLESMIEHELNPDKFKKKSRYDDDEEYGPDYY